MVARSDTDVQIVHGSAIFSAKLLPWDVQLREVSVVVCVLSLPIS